MSNWTEITTAEQRDEYNEQRRLKRADAARVREAAKQAARLARPSAVIAARRDAAELAASTEDAEARETANG